MPFQKGHSLSNGRPKGSQNKITIDTKKKLQYIMDEIIDTIDVSEMNLQQKLQYIQIVSNYLMPKQKQITLDSNKDFWGLPKTIEIISRDQNGEWKSEKRDLPKIDTTF